MESALALSAATWAVAMAVSPVLQIRRIVHERSSRALSIPYLAILLVGFGLWTAYGVSSSNLALVVPNAVAAIVMAVTIAVAARYR